MTAAKQRAESDVQGLKGSGGGEYSCMGPSKPRRLKKKEDRSDYVHENKQTYDNLPETKDAISTQLHDILQRTAHILRKPSALFSQFERWGPSPHFKM